MVSGEGMPGGIIYQLIVAIYDLARSLGLVLDDIEIYGGFLTLGYP